MFEIYMFVQLWNSFPEELKTTKQKIIYINVTKPYKIINNSIGENTKDVYHVTM